MMGGISVCASSAFRSGLLKSRNRSAGSFSLEGSTAYVSNLCNCHFATIPLVIGTIRLSF